MQGLGDTEPSSLAGRGPPPRSQLTARCPLPAGGASGGVHRQDPQQDDALGAAAPLLGVRGHRGVHPAFPLRGVRAAFSALPTEVGGGHTQPCRGSAPSCPCRDNYGFVTYRYAEEAFAAIESGHKLRRPDEQPFDLCFGGRRQFCRRNYADLGESCSSPRAWILSFPALHPSPCQPSSGFGGRWAKRGGEEQEELLRWCPKPCQHPRGSGWVLPVSCRLKPGGFRPGPRQEQIRLPGLRHAAAAGTAQPPQVAAGTAERPPPAFVLKKKNKRQKKWREKEMRFLRKRKRKKICFIINI